MGNYARVVSEKKQLELPHSMGEKNKLKLQMASSIMAGLLSNPGLLGPKITDHGRETIIEEASRQSLELAEAMIEEVDPEVKGE